MPIAVCTRLVKVCKAYKNMHTMQKSLKDCKSIQNYEEVYKIMQQIFKSATSIHSQSFRILEWSPERNTCTEKGHPFVNCRKQNKIGNMWNEQQICFCKEFLSSTW